MSSTGDGPEPQALLATVPTGLLFVTLAVAGTALGHRRWYELPVLVRELDTLARHPGAQTPGIVLLTAVAVLVAAMGSGLVVQMLAGVTHQLWSQLWPAPLRGFGRLLTRWRARRWIAAGRALDLAWRNTARGQAGQRPPGFLGTEDTARLNALRNRISLTEPRHPTWIGDRIRSTDDRVLHHYGLDLDSAWPRLWLIVPSETRSEIRSARARYDAATRLAAWSIPYLLLAVWWWPSALLATTIALVGGRRGRAAIDRFCALAESAVDLYGRDLSAALGLPAGEGAVQPETGQLITAHLRKGT
ncbi:hypothetical protein [Nocardia suismassiliense]|uniref:hypothetical protein n=1 Tax=Nocardia suismassiliense TaxID=2077092 RepID=UPI000D1E83A7|nr:hypothetical protein [Nocardia suismassiliense]